jgi:predicted CoA-substrate-specific enzyme activase
MKICIGIDAGSRAIKLAIINRDNKELLCTSIEDQGIRQDQLAAQLIKSSLNANNLKSSDIEYIVATGYGRNIISTADKTVTEITCHAKGVHYIHPDAKTIIEIGGQDSKWLKLDEDGRVQDFSMNDRCAAGTGRFLEVVSNRLEVKLEELGQLAKLSTNPAKISSMCVVFAETEIIGLLASGIHTNDIIAGVQQSISNRVAAMAGRDRSEPIYFTGGVALVTGMAQSLEKSLQTKIQLVQNPQFTGALGAALLAAEYSQ